MRVKREIVKVKKFSGDENSFAAAPAAKLVSYMWELTQEIWSLRKDKNVKRRLQRNITNLIKE